MTPAGGSWPRWALNVATVLLGVAWHVLAALRRTIRP